MSNTIDEDSQPLLPHHKIRFTPFDGNGKRFARLFRETWRRLPLYARRRILGQWRRVGGQPRIEYMSDYGRDAHATVSLCGNVIKFCSTTLDVMPDDAVRWVIAHELAHVFQWATGIMDSWYAECDGEDNARSCIEEDADEYAESWGFNSDAHHAWNNQHSRQGVAV